MNDAPLPSVFVSGAHNACARFLLCCLKCCFWCLEHFIKFMNRNAYIMVSHPTFSRYRHFKTLSYNYITAKKRKAMSNLSCGHRQTNRSVVYGCSSFYFSDVNIWEEFLCLSARRFLPVNEERYEVRLCTAARTFSYTHLLL